jgi:hypothetical protein
MSDQPKPKQVPVTLIGGAKIKSRRRGALPTNSSGLCATRSTGRPAANNQGSWGAARPESTTRG